VSPTQDNKYISSYRRLDASTETTHGGMATTFFNTGPHLFWSPEVRFTLSGADKGSESISLFKINSLFSGSGV
jgi:hypothetical protein